MARPAPVEQRQGESEFTNDEDLAQAMTAGARFRIFRLL